MGIQQTPLYEGRKGGNTMVGYYENTKAKARGSRGGRIMRCVYENRKHKDCKQFARLLAALTMGAFLALSACATSKSKTITPAVLILTFPSVNG